MRNLIILFILCLVAMLSCTGKERITVDKTPPATPILIQHLGDLGDEPSQENNFMTLTDDNNGIDAVPDGDWITLRWEHLLDTDLDYIKIFRFDEFNQIPALVDSINTFNDFYVDSGNSLSTDLRYSYFIEVVDQSGNAAKSDTVSYKLLSKQILISPDYGAAVDPDSIKFSWQKSGFVSMFRLLVFDQNDEYLWSFDIQVAFEQDFFEVPLPIGLLANYTGDHIYWRVDAFDFDSVLNLQVGSESNVRLLNLAARK